MRNMPEKRFDKSCVIIDGTELFVEKPFNLRIGAKTWSNYRHHHIIKGLIVITPYGSIWLLWKIMYGDQFMGDIWFTIVNELAMLCATLVILPFIKGRKQLPDVTVQRARQLSTLHIHIEITMEMIKNFKILKHSLLLTLVGHSSDILTVGGALTNSSPRCIKWHGIIIFSIPVSILFRLCKVKKYNKRLNNYHGVNCQK